MSYLKCSKTLALSAITLAIAGCGSLDKDISALAEKNNSKIADAQLKADKPLPVVTRTSGAWLLGQPVRVQAPMSPALSRRITLNSAGARISLADVGNHVRTQTGLVVDTSEVWSYLNPMQRLGTQTGFPAGVAPTPTVPSITGTTGGVQQPGQIGVAGQPMNNQFSVEFDGTVAGLLDYAANKVGVWWRFADGRVTFFREETKTFYLPALPNASSGKSDIASGVQGSSTATAGGGGANTTTSGGTSSKSEFNVDIWKGLEEAAKTVGGGAKVVTNSSVGSVTVTGTPAQIRNVEEWVKTTADDLSQQVQISVSVYRVDVTREENYSWNPSVIFNSVSGNFGFTVTPPQTPNSVSGTTPMTFTSSVLNTASGSAREFSGTQLAFKAISSLGRANVLYTRTLVSLNRRAAPLQIGNIEGYLASRAPSGSTPIGSTPLPPTMTPGSITTGFTANFIPVISNGRVILGMSMTISNNKGFKSVGDTDAFIQTANVGLASFEQSASLTPGDAILLTGYSEQTGNSSDNGVGTPNFALLGGGTNRVTGKQMMVIVVEAKVL